MTSTETAKTCTVRIHADGTVCGENAVTSFTGRDGVSFAECAAHVFKDSTNNSMITEGDSVATFHIGVRKVGTVVARRGLTLAVEVPIHGGTTTKVISRRVNEVDAV